MKPEAMKSLRERWWPSPLLSLFLLALWLCLNQSLAVGHILLGAVLAWYGPWITQGLRPLKARVRRPGVIIRLFFVVLHDIVLSNWAVLRIILGGRTRTMHSGFMRIPLDLRDPYGLLALAGIITACPGTVWAGMSADRAQLTIHVLDLTDESYWVDTIKNRYEKALMEIFE